MKEARVSRQTAHFHADSSYSFIRHSFVCATARNRGDQTPIFDQVERLAASIIRAPTDNMKDVSKFYKNDRISTCSFFRQSRRYIYNN
jgi:hypothetical protein